MAYWTTYCPQCGSELVQTTGGSYCVKCGWPYYSSDDDYWEFSVEEND